MSQKRMFNKEITDSDSFIDLPLSAQALYFHLNLNADDDGFINNAKKITRMIGASEKDFNILVEKEFIMYFKSGISLVKHWKLHNTLKNDRYNKTLYQDEMAQVLIKPSKVYFWKHFGSTLDPQYRIDKDSIGEYSIDKILNSSTDSKCDSPKTDYNFFVDFFNASCKDLPKVKELTAARKKLLKGISQDDFKELCRLVNESDFLTGKVKDFKASFDWIIKPANRVKILEGNYANKKDLFDVMLEEEKENKKDE